MEGPERWAYQPISTEKKMFGGGNCRKQHDNIQSFHRSLFELLAAMAINANGSWDLLEGLSLRATG